jgi:hypothetical protein
LFEASYTTQYNKLRAGGPHCQKKWNQKLSLIWKQTPPPPAGEGAGYRWYQLGENRKRVNQSKKGKLRKIKSKRENVLKRPGNWSVYKGCVKKEYNGVLWPGGGGIFLTKYRNPV